MTEKTEPVEEVAFDPEADDFDLDKDPADMSAEERLAGVKLTLYEIVRSLTSQRIAAEMMAELAGLSEDEIDAVTARAEHDEYGDLSDPDNDGRPQPDADEVFGSYEEAEAAGHDPQDAADRIMDGPTLDDALG